MPKTLRSTFLVHAVVAAVAGALLLLIPVTFLRWIGWAAFTERATWLGTDPVISRLLGAALLALAWSSFRGWRASENAQVTMLVEMEAVFTVLGCVGLLRHLVFRHLPAMGWIVFAILAVFAIVWIASLVKR